MKKNHNLRELIAKMEEELEGGKAEIKRLKSELKALKKDFSDVVQNTGIVIKLDRRGRVVFWNDFSARFFGYSQEEILGRKIVGMIVPEIETGGRNLNDFIDDICRHPEKYPKSVNENVKKNGERVWLVWVNHPVKNTRGKIVEILCAGNDISELKNAEMALREAEDRFRRVIDHAADAFFIYDSEGRFVDVNEMACKSLGYTRQELLSLAIHDIAKGDADLGSMSKDGNRKTPVVFESWLFKKSGEGFPVEMSLSHLKVAGRSLTLNLVRDISERRKMEEAIKRYNEHLEEMVAERTYSLTQTVEDLESEVRRRMEAERSLNESISKYQRLYQEFDALLEAITSPIMLLTKDLRVVWANKASAITFKKRMPELLGNHCWLMRGKMDICPDCEALKSFESGEIINSRRVFSGSSVFDITAYPVFDGDGKVRNVIVFSMDVTEKTRLEEETARTKHLAMLGRLSAGVAHEINNPNNYILFNATILNDAWNDAISVLDEYVRENGDFKMAGMSFLEMRHMLPELLMGIIDGSIRIKNIVDSLKDFARQEVPQSNLMVDINSSVERSFLILKSKIAERTDNFVIELAENIPRIKGNAQKIEQVLINLIENSLHALKSKSGRVRVKTCFEPSNNMVKVEVSDEGCGMTKEVLERIMEPFFTTKRNEGGTGLGLSTSYSIIVEHGGEISFETELGVGTTATVLLPVAE